MQANRNRKLPSGRSALTQSARDDSICVLYRRVSTKEQEDEGWSLDSQLREAQSWAERNKCKIIGDFVESRTAKGSARPAFTDMVRMLAEFPGAFILTEKTDRLTRNRRDDLLLESLNISAFFLKENRWQKPDAKAHERLVHRFKVLIAENYSENLSEEIRKGLDEKVRQGIYHTHAPLGYLNVAEPGTKRKIIAIDPARGPIVKQLLLEYASGSHSIKTLAVRAEELGLRTKKGNRVHKSGIEDILRNPAYCGIIRRNGIDHDGVHEPLISEATWQTIQDVMSGRGTSRVRYGAKNLAYRGMLRCACGHQMSGEVKKGKYTYYHCTGMHDCERPFVREEVFDDYFVSLLEGLVLPDFILEELCNDVRAQYEEERTVDAARMSALDGQLRRAKSRRERLYDDYADEVLSREEHDEKKRALVAEIREIEAAMVSLSGQESRSYDEAVEILELAKTAHIRFKSAGPDEKRQIVSAMLSNCKFDGEKVVADLNMPFDLMLNVAREGAGADPENEKSVDWWR